jgi:putative SOS response-associated peptidase YedK
MASILRTACIITTGPNDVMEPIHDRMPVILRTADWQAWLEAPVEDIQSLVIPYDADAMQAWPVDRRVSRTVDDDAGLIEPIAS